MDGEKPDTTEEIPSSGVTMTAGKMPDLERLGRLIRECRVRQGLTQQQLAERVGWVQERISLLEHGKYGLPSLPAIVRLAEVLDIALGAMVEAAGYSGLDTAPSGREQQPANIALQYALQRLLAIEGTTLEAALGEASDLLAQAMGADKIDAFMYEPSAETMVAMGTSNTPMGRRQLQLGLDREPIANRSRIAEVYQTGESYHTGRADTDPKVPIGVVEGLGVRSIFAVPLRPDSAVIGVLVAASAYPDRFSTDEREFFEAAARWVALVARRVELTEALTRAAAVEARRLAAEELVTLLAHDLGNALTPLKGRIDILVRRFRRQEREQDLQDVEEASRSIERLRRMVSELLDVARLDQGLFVPARQPVDLVSIVEDAVKEFRSLRPDITVRTVDELCIEADPGQIAQILANLLNNAVHHAPAGARISIGVGTEERDGGTWAVVSVHDEGPGIPRETLPQLFTRFTPGPDSTGLGLGLYLARSIAEAHGGTLTVDSGPDTGTTFWLAIPTAIPTRDVSTGQEALTGS